MESPGGRFERNTKAQEKVADLLREEDFRWKPGAGGIPTAIRLSMEAAIPVMDFWVEGGRCRDSIEGDGQ